ncbi:MAG: GWxTD domain-containing protein [Gemmatimonadetes bacterium]|nr:GWxTD domain-containing protein [Gemmatimonadota bacterium]
MREVFLVCAALVWTSLAVAQSPAERSSIETLREELALVEDLAALAERESLTIEVARVDRDNPMIHMELGFMAFRMGEISGEDSRYDDAAGEFEWAAELRPEWPYAWYGVGLAELALGEHDVVAIENLRQALGRDHLSKAARAFARATEADPSFVGAVLELAATARQQGVRARMDVALAALTSAANTVAGDNPELQLTLGRFSRDLAMPDFAMRAFERYLELTHDSSLGLLEFARTGFMQGRRAQGVQDYYGSASLLTGRAIDAHRSDIAWIATPAEMDQFDSLRAGEYEIWLRQFWGKRDAADLRRPGERLAEHYRRVAYARQNFRRVSRHRTLDVEESFVSTQDELDDRAVIYIRHGNPDRVASHHAVGTETNESWQYLNPEESMIFHFRARRGAGDHRLVESLFGFQPGGVVVVDPALAASRSHMHSVYRHLSVSSNGPAALNYVTTDRAMGRRAIEVGTTTDSYRFRFEETIELAARHVVLSGGGDGTGTLLVIYAVSGSDLEPMLRGDTALYPIDVRLSVTSENGVAYGFADTTQTFVLPHQLEDDEYVVGLLEMVLAPGTYQLSTMVRDVNGVAGAVSWGDTVTVPNFQVGDVGVSELLVGLVGAALSWTSRGDTVWINPSSEFATRSQMELYYEVYGLAPEEPYEVKIEVENKGGGGVFGFIGRLFGGGGPEISLEFTSVADSPDVHVRQSVDLAELDAGEYLVSLEIEFAGGRREEREASLTITDE